MSDGKIRRLAVALRSGWLRANAALPAELGLTYLNEAALSGISVPAPRRAGR